MQEIAAKILFGVLDRSRTQAPRMLALICKISGIFEPLGKNAENMFIKMMIFGRIFRSIGWRKLAKAYTGQRMPQ